MDSITESSLIVALESPNSTSLYHHFSNIFHPFLDFISIDTPNAPTISKTKKTAPEKKNNNKKETDPINSIRPLSKQFVPFLSRILTIIPSRLRAIGDANAHELLRIYRLPSTACPASLPVWWESPIASFIITSPTSRCFCWNLKRYCRTPKPHCC